MSWNYGVCTWILLLYNYHYAPLIMMYSLKKCFTLAWTEHPAHNTAPAHSNLQGMAGSSGCSWYPRAYLFPPPLSNNISSWAVAQERWESFQSFQHRVKSLSSVADPDVQNGSMDWSRRRTTVLCSFLAFHRASLAYWRRETTPF